MRGWTIVVAMMAAAPPAALVAQTLPVTRTAAGAYVQGSPAAKIKLVEYLSYTCPHCAAYVVEAAAALSPRVRARQVSVELRHAVRDPVDMTAALLARCGGAPRVFGNTEAIMRDQPRWLARASDWLDGNQAAFEAMPVARKTATLADVSGLSALMIGRGYTRAQLDRCLADANEVALLTRMAQASWQAIRATPTFAINGTVIDGVHNWGALQPRLAEAGLR